MAKSASYTTVKQISGNIRFNVPKRVEVEGVEVTKYVPLLLSLHCIAEDDLGGQRTVKEDQEVGDLVDDPLEGRDLFSVIPSNLKPLAKKLYTSAVDVDVSK